VVAPFAGVLAIHQDFALGRAIQPNQKASRRAFPAAAFTHQADIFALGPDKGNVTQGRKRIAGGIRSILAHMGNGDWLHVQPPPSSVLASRTNSLVHSSRGEANRLPVVPRSAIVPLCMISSSSQSVRIAASSWETNRIADCCFIRASS